MGWRLRHGSVGSLAVALLFGCSACTGSREPDTLTVSGNIEMTEVELSFKVPGRLVERRVDEGDAVQAGEVVARLDREELLRTRRRLVAELKADRSRVRELERLIQFGEARAAARVAEQQAALSQARAELEELQNGSRTQEIEEARALLRRARSRQEKAVKDLERARQLYRTEDISSQELDRLQSAAQTAHASMQAAKERLALIEEGPRPERIAAARARMAQARAALDQARALTLEVEKNRQALQTARAEVERAAAELSVLDTRMEDRVLRCPIRGVVLVKMAEPGEVLAAGVPVLSVADLDHPWLRAYIPERQLGRVTLGAPVEVFTDSFPGKVYPGRLSFLSAEAEFTPKQIQTPEERVKLVYRIKVAVENPGRELKLNMPVEARIALQSASPLASRRVGESRE